MFLQLGPAVENHGLSSEAPLAFWRQGLDPKSEAVTVTLHG
jgi:hypothetical protein